MQGHYGREDMAGETKFFELPISIASEYDQIPSLHTVQEAEKVSLISVMYYIDYSSGGIRCLPTLGKSRLIWVY